MKVVQISENEWNYLKDDRTYLLEENVCWCDIFSNGLGRVYYYDNTSNFVNKYGKQLLKTNVKESYYFINGFAKVAKDTKDSINNVWYYIDKECNFYNSDKVSFKDLYNNFPNMRIKLIEIIDKYTYHDVDEYFKGV